MAVLSQKRLGDIVDMIEKHHHVTVVELCEHFSISVATARRDLETLAEQGKVKRVHGGAVPITHAPPEAPANARMAEQADEKRRIGQRVAQLVRDGETVFLGSSTTVLEVARHLKERRSLTVITNSLPIIYLLADAPQITIIGLGGQLRPSEMSLMGHLTEQTVRDFRADKVIIGVRAIDPEQGLMNDYLAETATDRVILGIGREIIVAADHTKCGRIATVLMAPITAITTLVTNAETSPEFIAALEAKGVHVLTA